MSKLKSFRKIDRRNLLYGYYTYQVLPKRMKSVDFWTVQSWCEKKWGPAESWNFSGPRSYREYNLRWRIVYPSGRQSPLIYLKGENEAVMFSLAWADKT